MIGTVKWFDDAKGFGFINTANMTKDVFVHYSQIKEQGHKSLKEGQNVVFDLTETPYGYRAVNVCKKYN